MQVIVDWMVSRAIRVSQRASEAQQAGHADLSARLQAEAMALMSAASDLRTELEEAERSGQMGLKVDLGEAGDYLTKLKERMDRAGITAAELSRAAGVSPSQISRWFRTNMRPNFKNLERIELAMERLSRRKGKAAAP